MAERKICIVTGSRAEYGLLSWLIKEIAADKELSLQIVVTGAHLLPAFGETWREIEGDGYSVNEKVDIGPEDDSPVSAAVALGRATDGLARAFDRLSPDIVVVLGDRYEILGAASSALLLSIPVAHVHGGELTEGAFDDPIRHAVTKLSDLHFVAAAPYGDRIVQMGEDPKHVFNVGALGVDAARNIKRVSKAELETALDIELAAPLFVVTFHPVTRTSGTEDLGISALLDALAEFDDAQIIFTGVNADPGYSRIGNAIRDFTAARRAHVRYVGSLGARRYLSLIERASAVIGNSSSGIIEAPALGVPTVNIGDRQKGRLMAASIINCREIPEQIRASIRRALDPTFADAARQTSSPYFGGGAAARICTELKRVNLAQLKRKPFHDIAHVTAA